MHPIPISQRMQAIVQHIPETSVLADIGTDHAFIPIHTVQTGRAKRAIATDIREGPLTKARMNIQRYGLGHVIDIRLGDGLAPLGVAEAEVIVTAGVGGHVQVEMLKHCPDVARQTSCLIFQPMNAGHLLRQHLLHAKFRIVAESLVLDDDKVYEIIVAKATEERDTVYDGYERDPLLRELAYTYGPQLMQRPDAVFWLRLERDIEKLRAVQQRAMQSDSDTARARVAELARDIEHLLTFKDKLSN